ncbi:hypothetical protein EBZ38_11620 [bacterium]|nr:hypothetical protein [bacterium]
MSLYKSLEKACIKETKALVQHILTVYEVHRDNKRVTDPEDIYKTLGLSTQNAMCAALTQSGNMCVWKPVEGERYCKRHISLKYTKCASVTGDDNMRNECASVTGDDNMRNECTDLIDLLDLSQNSVTQVQPSSTKLNSLQKRFMEDSFYYSDGMFVYDKTMEKVGYVQEDEWVLTSNEFELINE